MVSRFSLLPMKHSLTAVQYYCAQEHVLERKGTTDELRELPVRHELVKRFHVTYTRFRGKEALVEKFKNSCIMDEREAWRPKIFYSEPGPEQGLPEPFPLPTHLRRKERSSYNRGALYVPGVAGSSHGTQTSAQTLTHRQQQQQPQDGRRSKQNPSS